MQLLHLLFNRLQYDADFFHGETRSNMLLTIPVECLNSNHIDSFRHRLVVWIANSSEPVLRLFSLEDFNTAQNFQSQLSGIVDQDEGDTIVGHQVARTDVLLVSPEVREGEGVVVDHLQKTLWPPRGAEHKATRVWPRLAM